MTVPHPMNCAHSDSGWCLECVAKLGNENWRLRSALQAIVDLDDGDQCGLWPFEDEFAEGRAALADLASVVASGGGER